MLALLVAGELVDLVELVGTGWLGLAISYGALSIEKLELRILVRRAAACSVAVDCPIEVIILIDDVHVHVLEELAGVLGESLGEALLE